MAERRTLRPDDERADVETPRAGSEDAEALFDRFHGTVYRLAMSLLDDHAAALDATREVFAIVVREAPHRRSGENPSPWISRLCVRVCTGRREWIWKAGPDVRFDEYMPAFTEGGFHSAPVDDWSERAWGWGEVDRLEKAIRSLASGLPGSYRLAFVVSDIAGLSSDETAEILELSVSSVRSRVHKARLYLRERLAREMALGESVRQRFEGVRR